MLEVLSFVFPVLITGGLVLLLRRIERWLHQHIFKVGWLLTQNYQTTTILYYTFFLPGVLLYEVTYWLVAGMLNVRADRAIHWPQAQEVGELNLNFVKLAPRTGTYKKTFISTAPLFVGFIIIWLIAQNLFNINEVAQMMSSGTLESVVSGLRELTSAPDFWLWFYLIFTIANTMFPNVPKDLQGWRTIVAGFGILVVVLVLVGVGDEILGSIAEPFGQFIGTIQGLLVMLISIDLIMTAVLGLVEYITESVTGRSATFKRGKMITMTRAEAIEQRQREREKERRRVEQQRRKQEAMRLAPKTLYDLAFPLPGAPGDEVVTTLASSIVDETQQTLKPEKRSLDTIEGVTQQPLIPEKADDGEAKRIQFSFDKPDNGNADVAEEKLKPVSPTKQSMPADASTSSMGDDEDVEEVDDKRAAKLTPKPNPFGTSAKPSPFAKPPAKSDEDDEDDEALNKRTSPSFASKPSPFGTSAKPSPFAKPPAKSDDEDEDDEALPKSTSPSFASKPSPFGTSAKPSPFAKPPAKSDNEDEDDEALNKRTSPSFASKPSPFGTSAKPSPFAKPPAKSDEEDEGDEALPKSTSPSFASKPSPFGTSAKPSPFAKPPAKNDNSDDSDDEDDEALNKRTSPSFASKPSPFGTSSKPSPFAKPPAKSDDEDEDDEAVKKRSLLSGLGYKGQQKSTFDDDEIIYEDADDYDYVDDDDYYDDEDDYDDYDDYDDDIDLD
jgi:hypothetical protein